MEIKIQKRLIDTGFGFPIRLINVPMVKVRGVWTPKINYDELAQLYNELVLLPDRKPEPIHLDAQKLVA